MAFLAPLGTDTFGLGVIVLRVEVDYLAAVDLGPLEVDVEVLSLGRTSFRLAVMVRQAARVAARAEVVLVVFDYTTTAPRVLSTRQREALSLLLR